MKRTLILIGAGAVAVLAADVPDSAETRALASWPPAKASSPAVRRCAISVRTAFATCSVSTCAPLPVRNLSVRQKSRRSVVALTSSAETSTRIRWLSGSTAQI